MTGMLDDGTILSALIEALEAEAGVLAVWRAGAAAFERVDEWSDIDLMIVVQDEQVEQTLEVIDVVLRRLAPLELRYRLPQPTWHRHEQVFYRLEGAGPFKMLDIAVMKESSEEKFLQPEVHGQAQVFFDKAGVVRWEPFDWEAHQTFLKGRLETLKITFDLFQVTIFKELNRGCLIDALAYYHAFTLRPLVEALRIQHDPARYNFGPRYLYYDLPEEDVKRLEALYLVGSAEELGEKRQEAEEWFWRLVGRR
jgi:predicted nucleotidyltransferase